MEQLGATITDATESPKVLVDEIKEQIATLEAQVNTLRDSLYRERAHVRDLFTAINDDIESNEWNEEDTITLKEVSDYLEAAFSSKLVFTKEYEAYVEFTVKTTVKYRSENAESAQEIADSIGLDLDEDDVNYDGAAEVNEFWVESTRVLSVEEQ
jgi:predicted metal-dependent RNase